MKRSLSYLFIALFAAPQLGLWAQEAATGGQANSTTPAPANQPSGLLTPPPDNAPTPAPSTEAAPEPTKKPSAELSPRELARVQQQAIIRRQELLFNANEAMATAQKAELANQWPLARQKYAYAAEAYGSISRSTVSYANAAEGLTRVDFNLYNEALKTGDTKKAKLLIDEVIQYNPNNKAAQEKEMAINRALANPNDTSLLGNAAITPAFVKKVNEVEQLFAEAEQFRRTGQWDEAEARLKRILGIDPYNKAATLQLERIDKEKDQYAEAARQETRTERLRQVEETWYEPIINKEVSTSAQESQPSLTRQTNFSIEQKLKSIFVSLDMNSATIEDATNLLSSESKRLDTQDNHKGIDFIILPAASTSAKPITLTLNNVPLGEALRYICQLANVKYKVGEFAISIVPFSASIDDVVTKTFHGIQPSFVAPPMEAGADSAAATSAEGRRPVANPATATKPGAGADTGDTVRTALEAKGIKFPPDGSVVYSSNTGDLTVRTTADQMDLLEELVNAGQAPTLMVRISTKFVEINQRDLNDLTFNSGFNVVAPIKSVGKYAATPAFNTSLAGAGSFSPDSIDQLIVPASLNSNSLSIGGFIDGYQYNVFIQALAQKKSFDLLTEPYAITKSGEKAKLEADRVFPYPIAFDPPELVTQTITTSAIGVVSTAPTPPTVIPSTPTDFKRRNVGVSLTIIPQVAADNKTIDLSLVPEVTDFEGFINYGSEINVGNPDGSTSLLSPNLLNQPVFNTRRIQTKVQIRDGSTVVLGGLIREDLQKIDEKVPILGDIPLLGRLFQGKAVSSNKRNLIIFVTATIYQNDGELLNPPEVVDAADVLTGRTTFTPAGHR